MNSPIPPKLPVRLLPCRYENGKYKHKMNTFTDFVAAAEHLIEKKYTQTSRLCIQVRISGEQFLLSSRGAPVKVSRDQSAGHPPRDESRDKRWFQQK